MITTSDGHTIEIKSGSFCGPSGVVQVHTGVKSWLLVDGKAWYSQHFLNGFLMRQYIMDAEHFTFAEWIEYCGDDIEPWEPDITLGADNVRTAGESQAYLKTIPAFKNLFESHQ